MNNSYVIHWFRRDLRLEDNTALAKATEQSFPVKCIFIFDTQILEELPKNDRRVSFIHKQLARLKEQLRQKGSELNIYHGDIVAIWEELAKDKELKAVFTNRDYEPYARERDAEIKQILGAKDIELNSFKDQVIFEKNEIVTQAGKPYSVYTPYSKMWKSKLAPVNLDLKQVNDNFLQYRGDEMPSLQDLGFEPMCLEEIPVSLPICIDEDYANSRDYPALDSTTHLSTALRFGTLSIRQLVLYAQKTNETFLNELIWREFFMQILWNYPEVVTKSFRPKYEGIEWINNEADFEAWCRGETGYPIVDAGMRELNATGYMHNRVRMITASFLVKHLLIDWRWGEAYFAEKLLDYELSSNNGNWQWVAGCGTDAAPYFRIFNPESQQKKFDAAMRYVHKWVPEYGTPSYPQAIVDHKFARERCLAAYKEALL